MRIEFFSTLFTLTLFYSLIVMLAGGAALGAERLRRLRYGAAAVGFLALYALATLLVVWIPPTWAFAVIAIAVAGTWFRADLRSHAVELLRASLWNALLVTALALVFLIPAYARAPAGMFTEAGGDFTIYAGLPAKVGNHPLWTVSSEHIGPVRRVPFQLKAGGGATLSEKAAPPSAGWSIDSIVELDWGSRNPGWYSLQHVLFQLSWGPLEWQYMGILAVLWAILVLGLQRLVHLRYGVRAGLLMLLALCGSHALIAVAYNHYLPQLLATTLTVSSALLLGLTPELALRRPTRIFVAAITIAFIGIAYYPMLPAAVIPIGLLLGTWQIVGRAHSGARSRLRTFAVAVCGAYIATTVALLYYAQWHGLQTMVTSFLLKQPPDAVQREISALGAPRPHNLAFFDAMFGGVSLQLLPPYSLTDPTKAVAAVPLVVGGALLLGSLCVALVTPFLRRETRLARVADAGLDAEARFLVAFSASFALLLDANLILGRKYEYTQFKGLGYVLPFTLTAAVLGGELLLRRRQGVSAGIAAAGFVLFVGSLAYFQVDALKSVANRGDRAAVLDQDVPRVAAEIRSRDPEALVLAFPAHPAQYSLWELGLRDTRALTMRYYGYAQPKESYLRPGDLAHLWVLENKAPAGAVPAGSLQRGSVDAYPATAASSFCTTRVAVLHADGASTVAFGAPGRTAALWRETDPDYWIFNPTSARRITVFLKESQAFVGRTASLELLYPRQKMLRVPVSSHEGTDAVISLPVRTLPRTHLLVLRVPGTGYSTVSCG